MALVDYPVVPIVPFKDVNGTPVPTTPEDNFARLINQANGTKLRGQDIQISNPRQHPSYTEFEATLITIGPSPSSGYSGGTVDFEYNRLDLERVTHKVANGDDVFYDPNGNPITTDINGLTLGTERRYPDSEDDFSLRYTLDNPQFAELYGANVAYIPVTDTVIEAGDAGTLDKLILKINEILGLQADQLTLQVQRQPHLWVDTIAERDALTYVEVNNVEGVKMAETIVGVRDDGNGEEDFFKPGSYSEVDNTIQTWNDLTALPLLPVNEFADLQVGVSPVPLLIKAREDSPFYVGETNIYIDIVFADLITKSSLNGFAYEDEVVTNQAARDAAAEQEEEPTTDN